MIYKCHPSEIGDLWPIVEGWLSKSLNVAPPWWSIEGLRRRCELGSYVAWLILIDNKPVGIALSELEQYDTALVCNVPWVGGIGLHKWYPELEKTIEAWGRAAGAKYLACAGRRGWSRVGKFKEIGTIMCKEL